jgi:thiol-disulfide isomerase/thioredoxin
MGNVFSLDEMRNWIVVLNFWSAECTWCERVDDELINFLDGWKDQVIVVWIASNANETSEFIEGVASVRNLPVVLVDEQQQIANLYGAETTPHFFIVDRKGKLAYQGAWDDITFRQRTATQVYVPRVVKALHDDQTPEVSQTQPYGCVLVRFNDPDS